jgi:mRNA interferase MazF
LNPAYPKTGDVFLADLDPTKGSEQQGKRPVVIFQNPDLNQYTRTFICIPLTTNLSRSAILGTCFIKKGNGGLTHDSIALCFQLRAIDQSRLTKKLGTLNKTVLDSLVDAILSAMGIEIG